MATPLLEGMGGSKLLLTALMAGLLTMTTSTGSGPAKWPVASALGGQPGSTGQPELGTGGSARLLSARISPTAKAPINGLVDQSGLPSSSTLSVVNGADITVSWAELQPTQLDNQNGVIVHPNPIDNALTYISNHPAYSHVQLKLTVFAGRDTPAWATNLDGPAFPMNDYACMWSVPVPTGCNGGSLTYEFPRWWGTQYQGAYDRFEAALGAAYDSNPAISEVASPRCMTIWAEPLVRPYDTFSMSNLLNAGYTTSADLQCQQEQLVTLAAAWPTTNIALNINTYFDISWVNGLPSRQKDLASSQVIAAFCRQNLGARCLLGNQELGKPSATPGNRSFDGIYPLMQQFGPALSYEVADPGFTQGNPLSMILSQAVLWHADSVEMTNYYLDSQPSSFFAFYAELLANKWTLSRLGGVLPSGPDAAIGESANRIDVVTQGYDGSVWDAVSTDSGLTYSWVSLGAPPGGATSSPSIAAYPGHLEVFVRALGNQIWHKWWSGSGAWSGWYSLGGDWPGAPDAYSWGSGRLDVVARGWNNYLYHAWYWGGSWHGWEILATGVTYDPSIVSSQFNQIEVFWRGDDSQLWHRYWNGTSWSGAYSLGGVLVGSPVATSPSGGRVDVFVRGTNYGVWHAFWAPGLGAWTGFTGLGGTWTSDLGAISPSAGHFDIFSRAEDNALWQVAGAS